LQALTAGEHSDIFITVLHDTVTNVYRRKVRKDKMAELITKIKVFRENYKITQQELADRVGVRRETIVRLEQGKYNPSLKLAADIAKVFDTAIENVFFYEEQEKADPGSGEKE